MITVLVKRLHTDAILPVKATPDAAAFDLHVMAVQEEELGWTVHTGLAVALPQGYGMMLHPRSGLSTKLGLTLRNSTGIVDADYRGEIQLKFHKGFTGFEQQIQEALKPGNRIAQALILQVPDIAWAEVESLPASDRGTGGFGSTGS